MGRARGSSETTYVSTRADLADGVFLGRNVTILGPCRIGAGVLIEDNCVIGAPSGAELRAFRASPRHRGGSPVYADYEAAVTNQTFIGAGCLVMAGCVIHSGAQFDDDVLCENMTVVRANTRVGAGTELKYAAQISADVAIGSACRISGFVANDCRIGDQTSSFGQLVHAYTRFGGGRRDPAPVLGQRVTVGFGAIVVGGVTVADDAYVAAGSIVTRDVPPGIVVTGLNEQRRLEEWPGSLRDDYPGSFETGRSPRQP
jgi:acetyltransferase-like isoleucine patch superfamily enzyme